MAVAKMGIVDGGPLNPVVHKPESIAVLLNGVRRWAVSSLILLGLIGTFIHLGQVIPKEMISEGSSQERIALESRERLVSAFLPSICGILGTLFLVAGTSWLDAKQQLLIHEGEQFLLHEFATIAARRYFADYSLETSAQNLQDATGGIKDAIKMLYISLQLPVESLIDVAKKLETTAASINSAVGPGAPILAAIELLYDAVDPMKSHYAVISKQLLQVHDLLAGKIGDVANIFAQVAELAEYLRTSLADANLKWPKLIEIELDNQRKFRQQTELYLDALPKKRDIRLDDLMSRVLASLALIAARPSAPPEFLDSIVKVLTDLPLSIQSTFNDLKVAIGTELQGLAEKFELNRISQDPLKPQGQKDGGHSKYISDSDGQQRVVEYQDLVGANINSEQLSAITAELSAIRILLTPPPNSARRALSVPLAFAKRIFASRHKTKV